MKITAKIVLPAMLLALAMQSTTMAGTTYRLKPVGEIMGNMAGKGLEYAQDNPEEVEKAVKELTGDDKKEAENQKEKKKKK